jgi:hypothetical protein
VPITDKVSEMSVAESEAHGATINDLPEEVVRHVLSLLSPYGDLKSAMLVCRYWSVLVIGRLNEIMLKKRGLLSICYHYQPL